MGEYTIDSMDINKFIVQHSNFLSWLVAALMIIWYISGFFAVDYIEAPVFVAVWIPLGILGTVFAYKW